MNAPSRQQGATALRREQVEEREGVLVSRSAASSAYGRRWDEDARTDHVGSATARSPTEGISYEALTAKVSPLWGRIPEDLHIGSLLDIGCGYGRMPLYLTHNRRVSCDEFYPVDVSEVMLRRLLEYRRRFGLFPGAEIYPIHAAGEELPLADDSIDVAVSSGVLLHMAKHDVRRALTEVARVLKPGGHFLLDASFPNGWNPANLPPRLIGAVTRAPSRLRFYSLREVAALIHESGLDRVVTAYTIEPAGYALLPKTFGPKPIPLARRANEAIGIPRPRLRPLLTISYSAYSDGLLT